MPQPWQCDVCGTRYRVAWLSHCYRCEGSPPKAPKQVEKPSRRKRMARIVTGVGPSDARAALEHPSAVEALEAEVLAEMAEPEPVAAPVEPEPVPVVVEDAPEPIEAPAPIQDAPVAATKDGAL